MASCRYNRYGYLDAITARSYDENNLESDCPVRFFIGQPDGLLFPEEVNDNKITGKLPRKLMYADLNDDQLPDIIFAGHGVELPGVPSGTYPMLLMNSTSVVYNDIRHESLFGYYHGSACGDIDNEGNIDIILPDASNRITHTLVNDGAVNFAIIDNLIEDSSGIFTCDPHDINHDGFLDLIWGGGADGKWDGQEWRTEVI